MSLPAGTTPESVVRKMRPGCFLSGTCDGFGIYITTSDGEDTDVIGGGETEELAWLSALTHLAEVDPEAFVKAVWPKAKRFARGDVWSGPVYFGDGQFLGDDWQSAADRIINEMKGEGR